MKLRVKRVYEPPGEDDGQRVLVDRLWPRGLAKDVARIDLWVKDIAPSNELRRWYGHEPAKWDEFRRRYFDELQGMPQTVETFVAQLRAGTVTLLFGSRESRWNNAHALAEFIRAHTGRKAPRR